jgi:translation initiation factor 4E
MSSEKKKSKDTKSKPSSSASRSSSSSSTGSSTSRPSESKRKSDSKDTDVSSVGSKGTTNKGELVLTPDPKNFEIKHPLQSAWTMWYNAPQTQKGREAQDWHPKKIVTFDTVEDFWCLFNHLVPPSRLVKGSNYHMFKEGIAPEWEDPLNKAGGKWIIQYGPKDAGQDDHWMYTLLAMIGEEFEDSDDICGAVFSPRQKQNKLALWTGDARKKEAALRTGRGWKEALGLSSKVQIGYQSHEDALSAGFSYKNQNIYTV